jgi:uncharacterized protein (DUF3084 family)
MSEKLVSPQTEMDPLQDALMDVRQMRETIEALRGEMESISFLKEQAVQEAKALSYDEIKQLKDTSGALRESLDDLNFDKTQAVQAAVAISHDEIVQLKDTASALRETLEEVGI